MFFSPESPGEIAVEIRMDKISKQTIRVHGELILGTPPTSMAFEEL